MGTVIRVAVFSIYIAYASSTKFVKKLHLKESTCPCSVASFCDPITTGDRKEIVGFDDLLDYYKQYDWNKLTTIIVTQDALEKAGVEFVCYAHQHKTRVLIATSISRDELRNATARKAVEQKYLAITKKYYLDGANIDVEILTPQTDVRQGLTDYVKETTAIHKAANPHSLVVTDVPWLPDVYQGHDTWALAKYSDFLFIMAYDELDVIPPCLAGPNAPIRKTTIGAKLFLDIGIPASKLVLALPWYGYRFNCTHLSKDGICVTPRDGFRCLRAQLNYGEVRQILSQSEAVQQWSDWFKTPYTNHKTSTGVEQIWYDDARSLKIKYDLADGLNFRGVGIFTTSRLNYANASDPTTKEMWAALPLYNDSTVSFL